jgi:MFS transporter, DHA2 family, multidrug resistance protein
MAHAALAERVTAASPAWNNGNVLRLLGAHTPAAAALLDLTVTRQAAMIGYIDDFWFMLVLTLMVTPLLLLIRPPRRAASVEEPLAVVE